MGLFSALFGGGSRSKVHHLGDRVWLTHGAKLAAIRRDIHDRVNDGAAAILLVAHFEETREQLDRIVESLPERHPLTVVLVEELQPEFAERLRLDESVQIDMIVAERHLLDSEDKRLIDFANQLPCTCRIGQHMSIEDPLIDIFIGESVRNVLEAMGMTEHESIESSIVSRRIKSAQKKIAASATGNRSARSAAEWLERNFPS